MNTPTRSLLLAAGLALSAGCAENHLSTNGHEHADKSAPPAPAAAAAPAPAAVDPATTPPGDAGSGAMAVIDGKLEPAPAIAMGDPAVVARIIDEGKNHNHVMEHLTYICTKIGPRLTGSTNVETANRWAAEQFKSWGLKVEGDGLWKWGEVPVRFDRGPSTAKVVMKRTGTDGYRDLRDLEFTTLAWSAGTNGVVRAPVVRMPQNEEEFATAESNLKGAWVLVKAAPPGRQGGVRGAGGSMSARQASFAEYRKKWAGGAVEEVKAEPPKPYPQDGVSGWYEGTQTGGRTPDGVPFILDLRLAEDGTATGEFGVPEYRVGPLKDGTFDKDTGELKFTWEGRGGATPYTLKITEGQLTGESGTADRMTTYAAKRADAKPVAPEGPSLLEKVLAAGPAGFISPSGDDRVRTGGGWRSLDPANLPQDVEIQVRAADYDYINSKLADGWAIEVEANLDHKLTPGPIPVYNTIAEIPGTEKPEEIVIVSAHLDSWNGPGSQGTTDNGTGSSVTLEAARILMAANAKPKRTIRFVLWTGEEQGLLGSKEYVKHLEETGQLDRISAVFVDDGGTNYEGGLVGTADMVPMLAAATAPVTAAFPDMPVNVQVSTRAGGGLAGGGSDHQSFLAKGVPAFFWDEVGRADYGYGWHTQNDRIDLAIPEYLIQSSTCAAVTAYNLACAPDMLPRQAKPEPEGERSSPRPQN